MTCSTAEPDWNSADVCSVELRGDVRHQAGHGDTLRMLECGHSRTRFANKPNFDVSNERTELWQDSVDKEHSCIGVLRADELPDDRDCWRSLDAEVSGRRPRRRVNVRNDVRGGAEPITIGLAADDHG